MRAGHLPPSDRLLVSLTFDTDRLWQWLGDHGVSILVIAGAALLALRLAQKFIPAAIARAVMRDAAPLTAHDLRTRANTLTAVLLGAARVAVLGIALLMVVGELGVDVVPVIAGLGIGGIAIGLGAQSLVRDAINGILILGENQFGKGDMIKVAGVQGWVEEVNLRRTVLRDLDGTVHSVPNSEIKVASNLTRGYSGVDLIVSIGPGQDLDRALAAIDEAGRDLGDDPELGEKILETPRVARIDSIAATGGVDVRVTGRVTPGAQWKVTSALRRRIVRTFDASGIRFGPPPASPAPTPVSTLPAAPSSPPGG
jgi:small conductance mechanosensitive channel